MRNHCIVTGCVTFHRLTNDLYWRLRRFFTMHLLHNNCFDAIGTMSDAWSTVSSIIDWWLTCPWAMHLCNYPPSIDWVLFSLNNKSAFPMKFFYKCAAMKLSVESYKIISFYVIVITTGDESSRTTCSKQQKPVKKRTKKWHCFIQTMESLSTVFPIHWRGSEWKLRVLRPRRIKKKSFFAQQISFLLFFFPFLVNGYGN